MVIDTSAIVAILLDEPGHETFDRLIEDDATRLVSAANRIARSWSGNFLVSVSLLTRARLLRAPDLR